ncbi:uncharacterized protein [Typha latifolia]|uniref:uncharacterized protein n=1 Tax=Typha latifolia TaxID=4733 RepID=UPI003C2CCCD0
MPPRPTPDHPPYALMIGAAIRSLGEEGGSTEASISGYIRANYDGLPFGHDRFLPYYLTKLTAIGEFTVGAPGRYLLPADGRKSGSWRHEAHKEEEAQKVNDGSAASVSTGKRRRGRPPKIKAKEEDSIVEPMAMDDYVLAVSAPDVHGDDASSSLRKTT